MFLPKAPRHARRVSRVVRAAQARTTPITGRELTRLASIEGPHVGATLTAALHAKRLVCVQWTGSLTTSLYTSTET